MKRKLQKYVYNENRNKKKVVITNEQQRDLPKLQTLLRSSKDTINIPYLVIFSYFT